MKLFLFLSSVFVVTISTLYSAPLLQLVRSYTTAFTNLGATDTAEPLILTEVKSIASSLPSMSVTSGIKDAMSKLTHAKFVPRRSAERGFADHGWLRSFHTFSFADYYDPNHMSFGQLRVLNEDRVAAHNGFPTHPHRDAEIFSYILNGELTHRDSMIKKGSEEKQGNDFFRMNRGDVQFTTGGTGIAHSEQNESDKEVHFLQIWALPWTRGLTPRYHTQAFPEEAKRNAFLPILSPLAAGKGASAADEKAAIPALPNTIPVHADLLFSAGIVGVDKRFKYTVGGVGLKGDEDVVTSKLGRKVYIHLPMTKNGAAKIRLDGREEAVLSEGDGAYISGLNAGDVLSVESIGEAEAEVVVLDSN